MNSQLAQVQSMAQGGGRTPQNHHQSFTDKLVEEALFPQGASSPPHLNNMHNPSGELNDLITVLPLKYSLCNHLHR